MHEEHVRATRHIRVDGHGENELVVLAVVVVEMVLPVNQPTAMPPIPRETYLPNILDISGVNPSVAVGRVLDEHHRRQIIDVPRPRNLDQTRGFALDQGLHPLGGLFRVIDLGPLVARPQPVHLAVLVTHTVVVLDTVAQQELGAGLADFPPRRDAASGRLTTAEIREQPEGLVQHIALLLERHVRRVLVRVPVQPDLMACVAHHGALLGERLERVARDEPCRRYAVLFKQLEQSSRAEGAGEQTFAHVSCMFGRRVGGCSPRLMSLVESSPP